MRLALLAVVVAAALPAASSASGAGHSASCRTNRPHPRVEAVLGHFASRAAAEGFVRTIEARGFKGFAVEDDGCGDFEVESDDIAQYQRTAFAREAEQSKLQVTWELSAHPDRPVPGYVLAVFGTRPTITAANALAWKVAGYGFRFVDIAYSPGAWRVVQPGIPVGKQAEFRAQVIRTKKLSVTFARR